MASSTLGSLIITGWNRRSSAASFSMYLRYSSSVVAPIRCSSPRESMGFNRLPASMLPSVRPAPTMLCSSSMNKRILLSDFLISPSTAFRRSSNSPRYFAPAISAPISSENTLRSRRLSGTSPRTIRMASPSAMAVLPTPGSPMSTGLFLVLRVRMRMTLRISLSRPMTGSSFWLRASLYQILTVFGKHVVSLFPGFRWSRAYCRARSAARPERRARRCPYPARAASSRGEGFLSSPRNRCSTLMYSSFIWRAASWAEVKRAVQIGVDVDLVHLAPRAGDLGDLGNQCGNARP